MGCGAVSGAVVETHTTKRTASHGQYFASVSELGHQEGEEEAPVAGRRKSVTQENSAEASAGVISATDVTKDVVDVGEDRCEVRDGIVFPPSAAALEIFLRHQTVEDVRRRYACDGGVSHSVTLEMDAPAPPDMIPQVCSALGADGHRFLQELISDKSISEWTACLTPLVDWVVAAAAAAPHDRSSKERERRLLAIRMFTINLTRSNFEDLRAKLKARMIEVGSRVARLPKDASGVDLQFALPSFAARDRPSRATQADGGVLPVPSDVDWSDPASMPERAYIHMLRLVAIAIADGFQSRIRTALANFFGEGYSGHQAAPPKTYARMLGKLYSQEDHRYETRRPRPMLNLDVVRAAVSVHSTADILAALAVLAQEFGGFVKEKNKYKYTEDQLKDEFYLRLILVSMVYKDGRTFGEITRDPSVRSQWEVYAAPGQAHLDGEPESRRALHIKLAQSWLQAPEIVDRKVHMICEVQVMTKATACVRHDMHELFKVYRAPSAMSLFKDFSKCKPVEPQDLWLASQAGELLKVEQFLAEAGVDVNCYRDGVTALLAAAEQGHADVASKLVDARADANKPTDDGDGYSPLQVAAQYGNIEVVEVLLHARADMEHVSTDGSTVLWLAASCGFACVVGALVRSRADLNKARKTTGSTPLLICAQNGESRVAEVLLNAGADTEKSDSEGDTPLMVAIESNSIDIVRLLLAGGANYREPQGACGTPLEVAESQGRTEIVEMLTVTS